MNILSVNTALRKTSIAVLKKENNKYVLLDEKAWTSEKNEAEKLMPEIDKMFKKNKIDYSEIKELFAVSGPGSFTGLRVGLVTVNTIGFLNDCPIFCVNTFDYLRYGLEISGYKKKKIIPALLVFAGEKGVFYNSKPEETPDKIRIVNIDETVTMLKKAKKTEVFGELSEGQKSILKDFKFLNLKESFGKTAEYILNFHKPSPSKIIKPLYIKAPNIT